MLSNVYFQDVKPGDVLQKKNMWEIIGEGSVGERPGLGGKVNIQIKKNLVQITLKLYIFLS